MADEIAQILIESRRLAKEEIDPVKKELEHVTVTLKELSQEVSKLSASVQVPWIKDRRFWAGLIAIPSFVLAGWTLDAVVHNPLILRQIHHAIGTEPVLVSMLGESNDLLNKTIEKQFAKVFTSRAELGPLVTSE